MSAAQADHWLWRLSAAQWLSAGERELELGEAAIGSRRAAITHARRGAGMALNGVLVAMVERGWSPARSESIWGRSYLDHLRVLAEADPIVREPFDAQLGECCRDLLAIPTAAPTGLVPLARGRDEAARRALGLAREIVTRAVEQIER